MIVSIQGSFEGTQLKLVVKGDSFVSGSSIVHTLNPDIVVDGPLM